MCQIGYLLTEDKEKPQNAHCSGSSGEYLLVFYMTEKSDADLIEKVALLYSELKQLQ